MAERGLDVLEKYDLNVEQTAKGRGVTILHTDKGLFTLKSYSGSGRHINFAAPVLDKINASGKILTDSYVPNSEGEYITSSSDGSRYIVRKWYECRECDIKSMKDISDVSGTLALLHNELEKAGTESDEYAGPDMKQEMIRRNNEIFRIKKYLKKKGSRNEFEQTAFEYCDAFYEEGCRSIEGFSGDSLAHETKRGLCHGNYNYHNVCFGTGAPVVINFEKMNVNYFMLDFYNIMRKLMEKYDWDIKLGYMMIGEYDRVRRIEVSDIDMLYRMFSFPEKFWKIINAYFNSPKSWIPAKNCEKLKKTIAQNEKRLQFIGTLR